MCAECCSGRVGVGEREKRRRKKNQILALQKIWSERQYFSPQHTHCAQLLLTKNSQILDVDIISLSHSSYFRGSHNKDGCHFVQTWTKKHTLCISAALILMCAFPMATIKKPKILHEMTSASVGLSIQI